MTAPYNIARWFSYSVTILPLSSYGSRGSPVYGMGALVACHIEQSKENTLGPDGNELAAIDAGKTLTIKKLDIGAVGLAEAWLEDVGAVI